MARTALPDAAWLAEQQQAVGEAVEIVDFNHAIAVEQCLIGGVVAGQRAGVTERQSGAFGGAAHLQDDDRNVALARLFQSGDEAGWIAHGFQEEADDPRRRHIKREVQVVRDRGRQLLAGRHRQVEAEAAVGVAEAGIGRTGMGDERDAAMIEPGRWRKAAYAQAMFQIVEAHAVAAADLQAGRARHGSEAAGERRLAVAGQVAAPEDGGGVGAVANGLDELRLDAGVGDADDDVIDRLWQRRQRGVAGLPVDLRVVWIDEVDAAAELALAHAADHAVADGLEFRRGADEGDGLGRQERIQPVGTAGRCWRRWRRNRLGSHRAPPRRISRAARALASASRAWISASSKRSRMASTSSP